MSGTAKPGGGYLKAAGLMLIVGVGAIATHSMQAGSTAEAAARDLETFTAASTGTSAKESAQPQGAVQQYLNKQLTLQFDGASIDVTRAELGASADPGASGDLPIKVDRAVVEEKLLSLKSKLDRSPVNAYMDLEARKVHQEQQGLGLDLFGSISAVEVALRSGANEVELEGVAIPPNVTMEDLGVSDISAVLGTFKTKFSVAEKTRNDNLKLLASKIDGLVLQPGQEFSFNETTGMRRLEDGFKMAHVILQGQMVDGMAGGSCQISSTLHGAAFFSGLDILSVTPHSRPSTYVTLGLDATVVAGKVDLKLRNPYDFPVVIHYRVARGDSYVEILGREKPFDTIEFERNIDERIDFEVVTREDPEMVMGHMVIDQLGYPGYKVSKVRRIYKGKKVIRTNQWKLRYRPVIEYARLGINPNPNLKPPKHKKPHGPKPASGKYTMKR
jgi:vancomycin resistance protein YoaR